MKTSTRILSFALVPLLLLGCSTKLCDTLAKVQPVVTKITTVAGLILPLIPVPAAQAYTPLAAAVNGSLAAAVASCKAGKPDTAAIEQAVADATKLIEWYQANKPAVVKAASTQRAALPSDHDVNEALAALDSLKAQLAKGKAAHAK